MAFCSNCGHEKEQESGQCPSCGKAAVSDVSKNVISQLSIEKGFFASLFDFSMKEIITPKIIRIVFVISVAIIALLAVLSVFATFPLGLILAPIFFVISVIFTRIYLELIIVIFNIYHELKVISHGVRKDEGI